MLAGGLVAAAPSEPPALSGTGLGEAEFAGPPVAAASAALPFAGVTGCAAGADPSVGPLLPAGVAPLEGAPPEALELGVELGEPASVGAAVPADPGELSVDCLFLLSRFSQSNHPCLQFKYPNPTAKISATRIAASFPHPRLGSSSSSSNR